MPDQTPRPVLITGFEKFDEWALNPSQLIVEHFAAESAASSLQTAIYRVLPTEYLTAGQTVRTLIKQHDPSVVLMLGLSGSRAQICLERFALNIDDVPLADNSDKVRDGQPIDPTGPLALKTGVGLQRILDELIRNDVDAVISNHAGTYVCNHVFYHALQTIEQHGNRTGGLFVHLPIVKDVKPVFDDGEINHWTMAKLIDAVSLIRHALIHQYDDLTAQA